MRQIVLDRVGIDLLIIIIYGCGRLSIAESWAGMLEIFPMKKNEDRKLAEDLFLAERGRITNIELAGRIGIHPATIARWKKIDEWDLKLVQAMTAKSEAPGLEEDFYERDRTHIRVLNDRIDSYLEKGELLTSEIRDLAEAKFHMMNCMEIINDQMRYPLFDPYGEEETDFD